MTGNQRPENEQQAYRATDLLVQDAKGGNPRAVAAVVELAARLCDAVDDMVQKIGDPTEPLETVGVYVRKVAERRTNWPALLGAHPAAVDDAQAMMRQLGLGRLHPYAKTLGVPQGPKRARMDSPAQVISIECRDAVVRLIQRAADKAKAGEELTPAEAEANALPTLTTESFERWFALGWDEYASVCLRSMRGNEEVLDPAGRELAMKKPPLRRGHKVMLFPWMKAQVKKASKWWVSHKE